jgi:dTMP kinase
MTNLKTDNGYKAKFITFEGGEGSGKSTQSKMLYEYLLSKHIKVIHTREIGGTVEAEKIRQLLLYSELLPISELMLVMAARCEHVNKVILPALNNDIWVICDRFIDSTACYQGQQPFIGINKVYELHKEIMTDGIMPDITFFLDIPPELALERTIGREDNNKFEDKKFEFHQEVYNAFQTIAQLFRNRIVIIEAKNLDKTQVHKKIVSALLENKIAV